MSIDVNTAVTTWNNECTTAKTELATMETALKADYNKYVDSLAVYLQRLQAANDVRRGYVNILGIEDVSNGAKSKEQFLHSAEPPIINIAPDYILDQDRFGTVTKSLHLVESCDAAVLLARKAL